MRLTETGAFLFGGIVLLVVIIFALCFAFENTVPLKIFGLICAGLGILFSVSAIVATFITFVNGEKLFK